MADQTRRRLTAAGLLAAVALIPSAASGADEGHAQLVDGIAVYFGMIPAEIILGPGGRGSEQDMHGGVPPGGHVYHLLVALFDAKTGRRITNAEVSAVIEESHQATARKRLEPMAISEGIGYGNYFDLPGTGPYRIAVRIRLLDAQEPIEAIFEYQHART